jgi:hypothetical protein
MDLVEIGLSGVHWIGLAQDRDKRKALVNAVMNLRDSYSAGKLSSCSQLHSVNLVSLTVVLRSSVKCLIFLVEFSMFTC